MTFRIARSLNTQWLLLSKFLEEEGLELQGWQLYLVLDDDDEFGFKDASTHVGHLHQNGTLTWFSIESTVMVPLGVHQ